MHILIIHNIIFFRFTRLIQMQKGVALSSGTRVDATLGKNMSVVKEEEFHYLQGCAYPIDGHNGYTGNG